MVSTFLRNAASTGSEATEQPVVDELGELEEAPAELVAGVERDGVDPVAARAGRAPGHNEDETHSAGHPETTWSGRNAE